MSNSPERIDHPSPPAPKSVPGEGGTANTHLQWVVKSVSELRDDHRVLSARVDRIYENLACDAEERSIVSSLARIECSISTMAEAQNKTNDKIESLDNKIGSLEREVVRAQTTVKVVSFIVVGLFSLAGYIFQDQIQAILKALQNLPK